MMTRNYAGSHDLWLELEGSGRRSRIVEKRGKNELGENRESAVEKFDTGGLSLHVFSIP